MDEIQPGRLYIASVVVRYNGKEGEILRECLVNGLALI